MKRFLLATLLLIFGSCPIVAQKIAIKCPSATKLKAGIIACPNTGCGGAVDPNLNKKKNIRTDSSAARMLTLSELQAFDDPVPGLKIGDTREKVEDLGEGNKISVVAYALVARKGGKESCNCGLLDPKNTDNHIVLVDEPTLELTAKATRARPATATRKAVKARTARQNTLALMEEDSSTAEFSPHVRLDHPKLEGARLQALIDAAPKKALLVRVTGLQFFDSEHSLGPFKLKRINNWEIHPVMKLEFCPTGKTCAENSDDNWEDLEDQP